MNDKTFLRGTGVALVTPFKKDSEVDFHSFENLLEYVIKGGIDYLVVMGTTAESATLTKDEKKAVLRFVLEKTGGKIPVVLGIGGNNTQAVVEEINETPFDGISALLSVAPYYNKPTQAGLFLHYEMVANASPVPVILYNVPGRTGVNIEASTTLKLAMHPNIMAVKEASGDLNQITEILAKKPEDFYVLSGDDALAFSIIALGGDGVISVIANALPESYSTLIKHVLSGNLKEARSLQYKLAEMMDAIFEEGNPAGVKAALMNKGIIENHVRLPLVPSSPDLDKKIAKLLNKIEPA